MIKFQIHFKSATKICEDKILQLSSKLLVLQKQKLIKQALQDECELQVHVLKDARRKEQRPFNIKSKIKKPKGWFRMSCSD